MKAQDALTDYKKYDSITIKVFADINTHKFILHNNLPRALSRALLPPVKADTII